MKGSGAGAADNHETAKWDPVFTERVANALGPAIKRYYRAEVRNIDNVRRPVGRWWSPTTPAAC